MEYIQWSASSSDIKNSSASQTEEEYRKIKHHVFLRFNDEDRSIEDFEKIFEASAEKFGFDFSTTCARYSSDNINECLNMAMKIFEIYLTVRNK